MTDIFPEFDDDDDIEEFNLGDDVDLDEDVQPPQPYGFTWAMDFDNRDVFFTPAGDTKRLSGQDTVVEWIRMSLATIRFESPNYGSAFGTEIPKLIGDKANDEYTLARIREEIVVAIGAHDRIIDVRVPQVFALGDTVFAYIQYETDDGQVEELLTDF